MKEFENIIIGAGIAGCSLAHFLRKYKESYHLALSFFLVVFFHNI